MLLWLLNYSKQSTLYVVWNSSTILSIRGGLSALCQMYVYVSAIENASIHANDSPPDLRQALVFWSLVRYAGFPLVLMRWQWRTEKLHLELTHLQHTHIAHRYWCLPIFTIVNIISQAYIILSKQNKTFTSYIKGLTMTTYRQASGFLGSICLPGSNMLSNYLSLFGYRRTQ